MAAMFVNKPFNACYRAFGQGVAEYRQRKEHAKKVDDHETQREADEEAPILDLCKQSPYRPDK